ncbi:MAG: hypothetical protein ACOY4R_09460 [Pseudomonadota bacterium]
MVFTVAIGLEVGYITKHQLGRCMTNQFKTMNDSQAWAILVGAAKRAAEEQGFALTRVPGRGRSNVWEIERKGKSRKTSIRTTRNRWFAFPPLKSGTRWKTLSDVEDVIVASVNDKDDPTNVEVYFFDGDAVRAAFDVAYAARVKAGLTVKDNFGMWINLDQDDRRLPTSAGSGLAAKHKPVAVYPIGEVMPDHSSADPDEAMQGVPEMKEPGTIADVMSWARQRIAAISGIAVDAVKLDLKIET